MKEKHRFVWGVNAKKMENSRGVTVNLTGNPGVQLQKTSISSTEGWRYNFFSEKGHFFNHFFCFFRELFTDDFGDISMMVQKFITQVNTIILYNTTLVDPIVETIYELSKSF